MLSFKSSDGAQSGERDGETGETSADLRRYRASHGGKEEQMKLRPARPPYDHAECPCSLPAGMLLTDGKSQ